MNRLQLRDDVGALPSPLESIEVYPCTLDWGPLATQLRELGVSNRDIAIALALAEDVDE